MIIDDIKKATLLSAIKGSKNKGIVKIANFSKGQWASKEDPKFIETSQRVEVPWPDMIPLSNDYILIGGKSIMNLAKVNVKTANVSIIYKDNINFKFVDSNIEKRSTFFKKNENTIQYFAKIREKLYFREIEVNYSSNKFAVTNKAELSLENIDINEDHINLDKINNNEFAILLLGTAPSYTPYIQKIIIGNNSISLGEKKQFSTIPERYFTENNGIKIFENKILIMIGKDTSTIELHLLNTSNLSEIDNQNMTTTQYTNNTARNVTTNNGIMYITGSSDVGKMTYLTIIAIIDNKIAISNTYNLTNTIANVFSRDLCKIAENKYLCINKAKDSDSPYDKTFLTEMQYNAKTNQIENVKNLKLLDAYGYSSAYTYNRSFLLNKNIIFIGLVSSYSLKLYPKIYDLAPYLINYNNTNPCIVLEDGTQGQEVEIVEP